MWCLPLIMAAICFGQPLLWLPAGLLWLLCWQRCGAGAAFCLLLLVAAIGWHTDRTLTRALSDRLPAQHAGEVFELRVKVEGLPERMLVERESGPLQQVRFVALVQSNDQRWPGSKRLQLGWFNDDTSVVQPGASLILTARLRPPIAQLNEGGFDGERHALARGIDARGAVVAMALATPAAGLGHLREQLSTRLTGANHQRPVPAALLPALVTGDRRGLTSDHWQLLRITGTAHLVAISGLHISLVAGLVWWLGRRLIALFCCAGAGGLVADRLAALPALLAATGYAALAGFSLPTQRALMMTLLVMMCLLSGRRQSPWQILLWALLLVTVPTPLALLDSGFWLSFGAVAMLLFLHHAGRSGLLRMQLLLTLLFGLLTALLFDVWSLSALPANLVLVPLFSLVLVPLALLAALLPGVAWLMSLAATITELSWWWLDQVSDWPSLPLPYSFLLALLLALGMLPWLLPAWPGPRWLLLGVLLPWLWPDMQRPAVGEVELVVFDVGQGQMMVVRTRHHLLVYDTGPGWLDGNAADRLLLPWLQRHRLQPDLIMVSHSHQDHAAGAGTLRARFEHAPVYSGEAGQLDGALPCIRGQRWWFDQVGVEVLWPPPDLPLRHSNNRSCVIRVSASNQTILLTGDIGREVEYWLASNDDIQADLLQVPHHGSHSSSSFMLLRAANPIQAFVSAGYGNAFGHPAGRVVSRYQAAAVPLYNTAASGMLIYRGNRADQPIRWRQHSAFPWRLPEPVVE
jgi:competence protein ComEC